MCGQRILPRSQSLDGESANVKVLLSRRLAHVRPIALELISRHDLAAIVSHLNHGRYVRSIFRFFGFAGEISQFHIELDCLARMEVIIVRQRLIDAGPHWFDWRSTVTKL